MKYNNGKRNKLSQILRNIRVRKFKKILDENNADIESIYKTYTDSHKKGKYDKEVINYLLDLCIDKAQKDSVSSEILVEIWEKYIPKEIQNEKIEKILDLVDPFYIDKIWKRTDIEVQKGNIEKILNSNIKYKSSIWRETSPEVQKQYSFLLPSLIKNSDSPYSVWSHTTSEVQDENGNLILNVLEKAGKNPDSLLVQFTWPMASEKIQRENFEEAIKIVGIDKIWQYTCKEVQKENFNKQLELIKKDSKLLDTILKSTNKEVLKDEKNIFHIMKITYPNSEEKEIVQKVNTYMNILNINENLHETVNLNIFDDSIIKTLKFEKLARITTYPDIQDKIIKASKNTHNLQIIDTIIRNSENWVIELNKILDNIDQYEDLLNNISIEDLNDKKISDNLVNILSGDKNYFNITNTDEVKNFNSIKKEMCMKILNGQEVEGLSELFQDFNEENRFSILQLAYGIDINEATDIVKKYGEEIQNLDNLTDEDKKIQNIVIGIKRILEAENIEDIYEKNVEIIKNWSESINYSSIADVEAKCINMYGRMYENSLYKPKSSEKQESEKYIDDERTRT